MIGDRGVVAAGHDVGALLARGDAARGVGDLGAGRRWFELAYGAAEQAGDAAATAEAVLGLGGTWLNEQPAAAGSVLLARLRRMVALTDPGSSTGLRLRVRLAAETDYRDGRCSMVLAALEDVRRAEDPPALALALHLAHQCLLGPDHAETRRDLAEELVGLSARTGQRDDLLLGLLWQIVDRLLDADQRACRRLAELKDELAHGNHLAVRYVVSAIEVMLTIRAGRLAAAEEAAQRCLRLGAAAGDIRAGAWHTAQLVAIRWYQGRLAELVPALTELVSSPVQRDVDDFGLAALAVAAASADDRQATAAVAALRGRDLATLSRTDTWLVTMNGIAEAAHLLDDPDAGACVYEVLSGYGHRPMVGGLGVVCFGSTQQALGVAALTMDNLDRAVEHLRAAVQDNLALGHWPAVVSSRVRLAHVLNRRGRQGDADEARRAVDAARRDSDVLGILVPCPAARLAASGPATCVRDGRLWRIEYGYRSVLVPHSVGMLHLAVLLANPGDEIPCVDLAAGVANLRSRAGASRQPVLDQVAIREYRDRLAVLDGDIDAAPGDQRERTERDWLIAELAAATGIGGRVRTFPNDPERARLAVSRAIRRSITYVARCDAGIGEHLHHSVQTGGHCSYRPA